MSTRRFWRTAALWALLAGAGACVQPTMAQDKVPPEFVQQNTFRKFFEVGRVRDSVLNARGNNPDAERKPALKAISDPQNLLSDNPAIKAAAKIKRDQDAAPQKIKAIKYLGTICCFCNEYKDEVKKALLAALDDCNEAVRYEAALAVCHCAGTPCKLCHGGGCCDAVLMTKLQKMATGQDDKACFFEPSCRVRQAAQAALDNCKQVHRPTTPPGTTPGKPPVIEEVPVTPGPVPTPAPPKVVPPGIKPAPGPGPVIPPPPSATNVEPTAGSSVKSASYTMLIDSAAAKNAQWPKAAPLLDSRWQGSIYAVRPAESGTQK